MAKTEKSYLDKTGLGKFLSNLKNIFIGRQKISTSIDFNTLNKTGIYNITGATTNAPISGSGTLYVDGEGKGFQVWIPDTGDTVYKRYKSGTWNDWFELKSSNPNALTLQRNSTTVGTYDGSSALTFNITPSNIGAASSNHGHSNATTSTAGFLSTTDKTKIDSMYKVTTITSATDWNTLTDTGIYHIKTTACTNCPTTNWGTLYVNGEGTVFQIWIPDVSLNKMYKRYKSGGWSDWATLALTDTVISKYAGSDSAGGDANNAKKLGGFPVSSGTNQVFSTIPNIGADGVMEVGKYIDFHASATSTSDYDVRITAGSGTLSLGDADVSISKLNGQTYDTGWQNITDFGSNIACPSGYRCKYRRVGKVVDLHGVIVNSAAINTLATSTFYKIFTLPSGCRPSYPMFYICGDLGVGKYWTMVVNGSGKVVIAKYNGGSTVPINTNLTFDVTFLVS